MILVWISTVLFGVLTFCSPFLFLLLMILSAVKNRPIQLNLASLFKWCWFSYLDVVLAYSIFFGCTYLGTFKMQWIISTSAFYIDPEKCSLFILLLYLLLALIMSRKAIENLGIKLLRWGLVAWVTILILMGGYVWISDAFNVGGYKARVILHSPDKKYELAEYIKLNEKIKVIRKVGDVNGVSFENQFTDLEFVRWDAPHIIVMKSSFRKPTIIKVIAENLEVTCHQLSAANWRCLTKKECAGLDNPG